MADVQIAVIDPEDTQLALAAPAEAVVNVAVPGVQGPIGLTGSVAIAQAGTAAEPGIRFESDTNTGIYSPGADQLAISTNGTGRLFVDASGNVGVRTGSPVTALEVNGTISQSSQGTSSAQYRAVNSGGTFFYAIDSSIGNSFGAAYAAALWHSGNAPMLFATNNSEKMRLDSSGRLGLGASSPATLLDISVAGGMARIGGASGNNLVQAYTAAVGIGMWAGGDPRFYSTGSMNFSTNATVGTSAPTGYVDAMTIDSSGRVGIGTSSPNGKLDVTGTNVPLIVQSTVAASNYITHRHVTSGDIAYIGNGGGGALTAGTTSDYVIRANLGSLIFACNGDNERLRIDSSGNVGIGTTSPNAPLVVSASGAAGMEITPGSAGASSGTLIEHYNRSTSAYTLVRTLASAHRFDISTTEAARIDSSGRVGIGTSSPAARLDVTGPANSLQARFGNVAGRGLEISTAIAVGTDDAATILNAKGATSGTLIVQTDSTERLRIDSSGRLLVGTSSSRTDYKFQVEGTASNNSWVSFFHNSNDTVGAILKFAKSRGTSVGANTIVQSGDVIGRIDFDATDGSTIQAAAQISAVVDGTPGAADMPGRLVFSVTADGAAVPTEALRISNDRSITVSDGGNVVLGTTTGTKIGTATTQKLGFYNATPVVQPTAVADATDAATVITQLNALLTRMRNLGLIAT